MAKLILTLAALCVFGAVMVKGLDKHVLQSFLAHLEICKEDVGANECKKEIYFVITNLNKK